MFKSKRMYKCVSCILAALRQINRGHHHHKTKVNEETAPPYLDDLGCGLGRAVPQVLAVDGQDLVVVPQLAVLGGQPPDQQVQDEDPTLLRLADELDPEGLAAVPLDQHHLDDRAGRGGGGVVVVVVGRGAGGGGGGVAGRRLRACGAGGGGAGVGLTTGFEALLLQDDEPQHEGGLAQDSDGPSVRDGGEADVVDLGNTTPQSRSGQLDKDVCLRSQFTLCCIHVYLSYYYILVIIFSFYSNYRVWGLLGKIADGVQKTPNIDYLRFYPHVIYIFMYFHL